LDLYTVYVLTNPTMPGLVKIGFTTSDPAKRIAELYATGVPLPFEVAFACKVPNPSEVEKALHQAFAPDRINPKREFFKIAPEQAIAILKLLHVQQTDVAVDLSQITSEEVEALDDYKSKRPKYSFGDLGILTGSVLTYSHGPATVTVSGDRKVTYVGEEMSLTAATRLVRGTDYNEAPLKYWSWQGKNLRDLYDETYGKID
jgi:hypothetical protein